MSHTNQSKYARIYLRVSTKEQDLERQTNIIEKAKRDGFYIAAVYKEVASGATTDRRELQRLISDLQEGDFLIAENMDRITRLPFDDAILLVEKIRSKKAILLVPGLIDPSDIKTDNELAKIVIDATQELLLRIALYNARNDYEVRRQRQKEGIERAKIDGRFPGRRPDMKLHSLVETLSKNHSIKECAKIAGCSTATVKRIRANARSQKKGT